jgi:predicted permease
VSRTELSESLKDGERHATSKATHRTRSSLVVAEVALALILLIGAGLSLKAFVGLARSETGFQQKGILTASVPVGTTKYTTRAALSDFYDRLEARIAAIPGVQAVAVSQGLPLAGSSENGIVVEGQPMPKNMSEMAMSVFWSTDGHYLEAMGIPLLAGRFITDQDTPQTPQVVVVDEVFAKHFFPNGDAIGKHLMDRDNKPSEEIVGIVKHVVNYGMGEKEPAPYQIYYPYRQIQDRFFMQSMREVRLIVRGDTALAGALAAHVAAVDPDQPIYDVKTMGTLVDESLAARRFAMVLLAGFAALALLLAAIGLYSVMSYTVAQRTHEIGVRMALGARPGDVQRLVIWQGMRLTLVGLALGVGGALALTRLMESLLYGIKPTDPSTFLLVAAGLAAASALACWIPARRATRVDPMVALRHD